VYSERRTCTCAAHINRQPIHSAAYERETHAPPARVPYIIYTPRARSITHAPPTCPDKCAIYCAQRSNKHVHKNAVLLFGARIRNNVNTVAHNMVRACVCVCKYSVRKARTHASVHRTCTHTQVCARISCSTSTTPISRRPLERNLLRD
jgi:hypothetical protein